MIYTTDNKNMQQLYQEGIFDRVGARLGGIANTKFLGGTGYNKGKGMVFRKKFNERIIKDIDKFLKEVLTMGNVRSLSDFETRYPQIAQKIRCMADAVGHTTGLTVSCKKQQPTPPIPGLERYSCKNGQCVLDPQGQYKTKEECEAKCGGGTPPPPSPPTKRWACRNDGTCYSRKDGRFKSKEECEATCRPRSRTESGRKITADTLAQQVVMIIADRGGTVNIGQIQQGIDSVFSKNKVKMTQKNKEVVKKVLKRYIKRDPVTGRFIKK